MTRKAALLTTASRPCFWQWVERASVKMRSLDETAFYKFFTGDLSDPEPTFDGWALR